MEAEVVGRKDELDLIERFLDAPGPGPSALVPYGQVGIGKTTLWQWGVDRARAKGRRVLQCRPGETEATLPFAGLSDLLEPVLGVAADVLEPAQLRALETALALVEPTESFNRLAVSRAGHALLRALAISEPLVLAIDDVQWLDPPTAGVLEFSVRRLADAPMRLLLTRRGERDVPSPLGLDRALPPERLRTVRIGPLAIGELDGLLRSSLDVALPRSRLAELHRITGGNPFYALEIVRVTDPSSVDGSFNLPESLGELLRTRLAELPPDAREAILLTAVSTHPSTALVEKAADGSDGLSEAIGCGILDLDGERLRFTHPLFASVAYSSAPPWERRSLHARLAEVATDPDEGALHRALATEQPDAAVAALLDEAADRAARRGAPATAAGLSDHACRLTPGEDIDELNLRKARSAEYHLAEGDTVRGRALLEDVVKARSPGPVRAQLLLRLGRVRYLADDVAAAHQLFEQALSEAGDDARVATAAEQALAFTAMFGGDIPAALRHAQASLRLADETDDKSLMALALGRVGLMEFLAGNGLDRPRMESAVRLEEHIGDVPVEWLPSYAYAGTAMFADDLGTARGLYAILYESALEGGDERTVTTLLFSLSQLECAAGNWGVAARHATEAVERSRQSGLTTLQASSLSAQALVSALLGRVDTARSAAEEGLELAGRAAAAAPFTWLTATLGLLELSLGDPAAAHARLGQLTEMVAAIGVGEPGVVRFLPDEIEALVALGEVEQARPLVSMLEERARALDRPWALATGARSAALLAAAEGDFDGARGAVGRALEAHERLEQPFELGRTLLAQGQIERRAKRRAPAREALTRALETFDSLGAPLWAEKAVAELARIPGRPPGSGQLTPTERQVAELVGQGLSNKEVAAALFVSLRTVEANLSKIYVKLGIRSRTELVRRLAVEATPEA